MDREPTQQGDSILIGANGCATTRQIKIDLGESAAAPTHREMRAILVLVGSDGDFLDHGAQQLFLVAWRGGWRVPHRKQINPEGEHPSALVGAEGSGPQGFTVCEFGLGLLEFTQAVLPLGLETAGDEAVVGVDGTIPTLGTFSLVVCPLHGETPLCKRAIVIGLEPLGSG